MRINLDFVFNFIYSNRHVILCLSLLLSSLSCAIAATPGCPVFVAETNGCSFTNESRLETVPNSSPACDRHDTCYSTIGATKGQCDAALIADMRKQCHNKFGKIPFIGHSNPAWLACEHIVGINLSVLASHGDVQKSWNYEQNIAMKQAISRMNNECDILIDDVLPLSTRESRLFGGSAENMIATMAGSKALNYVPVSIPGKTISNILFQYRTKRNFLSDRITCEIHRVQVSKRTWCERDSPWTCKTRSEPVYEDQNICMDYNWQNELMRDVGKGWV